MSVNRGKDFEQKIKEAFEKVPNVSIDRLHDQMTGYKVTSANICDFIVYKYPYEYYIECKSVHGNTLPFSNISDRQWNGLLEKSEIEGVIAGVIVWFVDKDVTKFVHINELEYLKQNNWKSIRFDHTEQILWTCYDIVGKKKRVFFDYDMTTFFKEVGQ